MSRVHRPGAVEGLLSRHRQDHLSVQTNRGRSSASGLRLLSENQEFSRRLEENGIVFIGPKHYSVAAMGDKIESKKLAIAAGVTIPGYNDAIADSAHAVEIAKGIGYPVMIKASAGGGGRACASRATTPRRRKGFRILPQ